MIIWYWFDFPLNFILDWFEVITDHWMCKHIDNLTLGLVLVWSDKHILPSPPHTYIYIGHWCDLMTPMMGRVWSTIQCTEYLPFGANWTSRCSAGHWGRRRPRLYSQRMHGSDYTLYIIHYMDLRLYSCTVKRCTDLMTAVQRSVFDV